MSNISGFEDLMNNLDNVLNQAESFEGKLIVNVENLMNHLDSFNSDFGTKFTKDTSLEELQEYFQDQYVSLMQEHFIDNVDYKQHFNDIYLNYAHIE